MESQERRQRREARAVLANVKLRGARARRSSDLRLRRQIRDAFARQRAGELLEDRQVGMEPDPVQSPDAERGESPPVL